jgi:hypothetical protein
MRMTTKTDLAETIREVMTSPNVPDANWEASNIVDVLDRLGIRLAKSLDGLAAAIRAAHANEGGRRDHGDRPSD